MSNMSNTPILINIIEKQRKVYEKVYKNKIPSAWKFELEG